MLWPNGQCAQKRLLSPKGAFVAKRVLNAQMGLLSPKVPFAFKSCIKCPKEPLRDNASQKELRSKKDMLCGKPETTVFLPKLEALRKNHSAKTIEKLLAQHDMGIT
jgi:hypothetical protein